MERNIQKNIQDAQEFRAQCFDEVKNDGIKNPEFYIALSQKQLRQIIYRRRSQTLYLMDGPKEYNLGLTQWKSYELKLSFFIILTLQFLIQKPKLTSLNLQLGVSVQVFKYFCTAIQVACDNINPEPPLA